MSQELIYTSAPAGLKPGSKGFCTVAMTSGMSPAWVDRLEPLSAYRAIFPLGDAKSHLNPVNFSHWRLSVGGKTKSVLSRVAFADADYTGRSNKLAHHVVLEPSEQAAGGPAWMLLQTGVMRINWTGEPQQFPSGPRLPAGDRAPGSCSNWAMVRGDAGWAGALAESFITDPAKPAYLVYSPGTDVLRLFEESLSLIDPAKRWQVTFSTFFSELPLNLSCAWRGVVAGTPAAADALRMGARAFVLDLTKPAAASSPQGAYADAARGTTGPVIAAATRAVATAPARPKAVASVQAPLSSSEDSGIAEIPFTDEPRSRNGIAPGRKKLSDNSDSIDLETDMRGAWEEHNAIQTGRRVEPHTGVSKGVLAMAVLGSLAAGAGACFFTYSSMRGQIEQAQAQTASAKQEAETAAESKKTAEAERDSFKAKAELAEKKANSDADNAAKVEHDLSAQIADLKTGREDAATQMNTEMSKLKLTNAQLVDDNARLTATIAELKKTSATNTPGTDTIKNDQGSTVPIQVLDEKKIELKTTTGDHPQCKLTLPAVLANAEMSSIVWPNNQADFVVTAASGHSYHVTQAVDAQTKKVVISTEIGGGTETHVKPVVEAELSAGQIVLRAVNQQSPSAAEAANQVAIALSDSIFQVKGSNAGKENITRFSLNRAQELKSDNNSFGAPLLPEGVLVNQLLIEGVSGHAWVPQPEKSQAYSCELANIGGTAFKTNLTVTSKEWKIEVDTTQFTAMLKKLKEARDALNEASAEADTKAQILKKKQDAKASSESIEKAQNESSDANQKKSERQVESDRQAGVVSDWRSKYESLSHQFKLGMRLPNGVEAIEVDLNRPQLPDER